MVKDVVVFKKHKKQVIFLRDRNRLSGDHYQCHLLYIHRYSDKILLRTGGSLLPWVAKNGHPSSLAWQPEEERNGRVWGRSGSTEGNNANNNTPLLSFFIIREEKCAANGRDPFE